MEYSLEHLNKITNLKNLKLTNLIEKLNIVGLEVDNIVFEKNINTENLLDIKLVIKIPADRDDLINQNILNEELSIIFLFNIHQTWQILKEKYFFILKKKYLNHINYSVISIPSNSKSVLTYGIKIENYKTIKIPNWVNKKLKNFENIKNNNIIKALIDLILLESGQNFNILSPDQKLLKIQKLETIEEFSGKNEKYFLNKNTIVLRNEANDIISILGIINHSIQEKTVLLESTFYDIHENELNLNDINTNLSYRYLRRSFINTFKFSFQRLLSLIEIIVEGKINSTIYKSEIQNIELKPYRLLKIQKNSFKKFLNIQEYDSSIFEKTGLKIVCKTLNEIYFRVPFFRKDLKREIDLIEEYTRFIGYKNFKEILPEFSYVNNIKNKNNKIEFIKQFFIAQNFNEIFTNSLISETLVNTNSIVIKNPLNSDFSILRSSLIGNILEIFLKNLRFEINSLKFFEIGRVYRKDNNKFVEEDYLGIIFPIEINKNFDSKLDWFMAKGFVENFLSLFSNKNFTFEKTNIDNSYYHPKRVLKITDNDSLIGFFGEIHPNYKKFNSLKQNIYFFEFNLKLLKLSNLKSNIKTYKEYSKYPVIKKDLSIVVSKTINFLEVKNYIINKLTDLKSVQFFDIYFDKSLNNKISLGIRLEFQSFLKTLVTEEIELEIKKLVTLLNINFNIELKL